MSRIDELAVNIAAPMQEEFKQFVQTGEASEDFLAYLEHDSRAQEAVEHAFDAQAAALSALAKAINEDSLVRSGPATIDPAVQVAAVIEQMAEIPDDKRPAVVEHIASNVAQAGGAANARRVQSTLSELQKALSSLIGSSS